MKTKIGWVILILGILAIIGGLTSEPNETEVEIIGYIFKIAMVIGGIVLISSKNQEIIKNEPNETLIRRDTFLLSEIEGFSNLSAELKDSNKKAYHLEIKKRIEVDKKLDEKFKVILSDFIIADDISFLKYFFNDTYFKDSYGIENDKFASPTLKFFVKNIGSKSIAFPSWFYCIYPDVAKWFILGEGKQILKNDFGEKLSYLNNKTDFNVLEEFLNTEFYGNPFDENEDLKIKPENLRELIEVFKSKNPDIKLECECE